MFHERLRELRKRKGLTQQQIADKLGIQRPTYTGYEVAKNEPSFNKLIQIADILDVTTDYLLGRNEKLETVSQSIDTVSNERNQKLINLFEKFVDDLKRELT